MTPAVLVARLANRREDVPRGNVGPRKQQEKVGC